MKVIAVLMAMGLAAGAVAQEGASSAKPPKEAAFGLHKGMSLAEAGRAASLAKYDIGVFSWRVIDPPKPANPFKVYVAVIAPKAGLCVVHAETEMHPVKSVKAAELRIQIMDMLVSKYGDGMSKSEVDGSYTWWDAQGPGANIVLSFMFDKAIERMRFRLTYLFSNSEQCSKEGQLEGL
jgi:hypothetical protein